MVFVPKKKKKLNFRKKQENAVVTIRIIKLCYFLKECEVQRNGHRGEKETK